MMNLRKYLMIKQAEPISFDRIPEDKKPVDQMVYLGNSTLQKHDDAHTPLGQHYTDLGGKLSEPGRYTHIGGNTFSKNIPVRPDYKKKIDEANKQIANIPVKRNKAIADRMKKNRMSYLKAMLAGAGVFGGGSLLMNMGTPVKRPGLYYGGMTAAGALSGLLTAALYNKWLQKNEGRTPIQSLWHNTIESPIEYFTNPPTKEEDWARMNKIDAERQLNNPSTPNNAPATNSDYKSWYNNNPPVIL